MGMENVVQVLDVMEHSHEAAHKTKGYYQAWQSDMIISIKRFGPKKARITDT